MYKGKIVTNAEVKRIKLREKKLIAKEVSLSLVWNAVYWFWPRIENLPLYEWIVLTDDWEVCKVKGVKRIGMEEWIWTVEKKELRKDKNQ